MKLGLILAVLLLAAPVQALTIDQAHRVALSNPPRAEFRIAHDSWTSYDKFVDHGFGWFALAWVTDDLTHAEGFQPEFRVVSWLMALEVANELKDAVLPWEKYGPIGGDGFSIKDATWSLAGCVLAELIH